MACRSTLWPSPLALLDRGEPPDAEIQQRHIRVAIEALAPLARSDQLVVTHGNGPQIGLLARESAADPSLARPYPLDVLGAQTQGMIGYWLLQGFQNAVPGREIASVITQTLVSAADPAFADPAKFVGPVYPEAEASRIAAERGWTVKADGNAWRRVVPSPIPLRVVETRLIRQLLDADLLVLLTDVAGVETGYGTPSARIIHRATPGELRTLKFPAGSMGPKVEAVCRFVELTGRTAAIGALRDVDAILTGKAGTIVTPSGTYP